MSSRFYVPLPLQSGGALSLPPGPARHVQVLRLQPGDALTLFNGEGGQWAARILRMGRSEVEVEVAAHEAVERELAVPVHLVVGMPANDRMDWLVEKATELGVASIRPLVCERSVLRLAGERADKKVAHWQGVAVAAAEQCGRTRVPRIEPVTMWREGYPLPSETAPGDWRCLLSLQEARSWAGLQAELGPPASVWCLSGPEGGLSPAEEAAARAAGWRPLSLGPRVLRAETAPLAVLAHLGLSSQQAG